MHSPYLAPTPLIDSDHPAVAAFSAAHLDGADDRARAVALYRAVRDGFRYDPYRVDLRPAAMKASVVLAQGHGWCVNKAALLAAACRAAGIEARVGYADVRNHLATPRMRELMQTDLFVWHGYTEIHLGGQWRKATPAFNIELCERFGLQPLEFDGEADSLYHPFDRAGRQHMEYVRDHGPFTEVPLAQMCAAFAATYPGWHPGGDSLQQADFSADLREQA